ncbi:hypothetical protein FRC04_003698 [Tulasnella sp. 424]|nr:hypothetical protein FRC04_003698 [Tulasnella sp. 424]
MPPKQKANQTTNNNANNHSGPDNKANGAQDTKGAGVGGTEIPGLPELLAIVETIASTPPGKEPAVDQTALEVIQETPLSALFTALRPVFLKLGIAEAAIEARSPWARTTTYDNIPQLKSIEEKVDLLSKSADDGFKNTLHADDLKDSSQALQGTMMSYHGMMMATLGTSTADTANQLDGIHNDVKALPTAVKGDITALDVKFAELRSELVLDAKDRIQKLEDKNNNLERELKELKDAVGATSVALIPVSFALEKEARAACVDALLSDFVSTDITVLAEAVKEDAFQLLSHCQGLFSVLSEPQSDSTSGILKIGGGFEEHWAEAMESVHRIRVDADLSYQSQRDAEHQLKLFGFLVDQVRDGQYSLDQWADASQRREFGEYIDQPFDGFDALQTVAEEIHELRRSNSL